MILTGWIAACAHITPLQQPETNYWAEEVFLHNFFQQFGFKSLGRKVKLFPTLFNNPATDHFWGGSYNFLTSSNVE